MKFFALVVLQTHRGIRRLPNIFDLALPTEGTSLVNMHAHRGLV